MRIIKLFSLGLLSCCSLLASTVWAGESEHDKEVRVELFAPANGDQAGIDGKGWFVDLAVVFEKGLQASGFNGFQITGPGPHNSVAPYPGVFAPGADEHLPGLVVLVNTASIGAGSCQNVANLFNLTGVTNVDDSETEIWDTWIVGAPLFGVHTESKVLVAVVADLDQDGVYNDAPDVIADADGDGMCTKRDLKMLGLASNIAKANFFIN